MKIAVLSDIHGNLPALEAVISTVLAENLDLVVVNGDVVAGPYPNETLNTLKGLGIRTEYVLGNAESEVLRHLAGKEIGGLGPRADEEARWVSSQLTDENKLFIKGWKAHHSEKLDPFGRVLFCHATPRSDIEIFTRVTPEEELAEIFEGISEGLVVCGHTHIQFDRMIGSTRVVNAGSVGMRFGGTGADWLLLDGEVQMRHNDYDLEKAADLVRKSVYPHAVDFAEHHILRSPDEADMMEMLSQLEKKQWCLPE